ncbi:DUF2846 domain-containing protein [Hymenobacter volaticus]|uniref:DUF2846 domain-containing protein n=1 Tax=Hymenobacter volaticus TaxID=2932254 RepID=A0ABY4GDN1_9BACT|nr:DUF2846 domain-containing protein [Hymenobacter volaticus]UOQ68958.1 DUF2846 domain-containing protein [Hymenobacter volaticus]
MKAHLLVQMWLLLSGLFFEAGQTRSSQARLILYRTREFGGGTYTINVNDQKLGKLPTNRYLQVELPPGRIKIESARDYVTENQTLWIDAQPGRTYYVKAIEEVDFLSQMLLLVSIGPEQAQRELQGIKPVSLPRPN